jgi:uncharacterized protein (DUF427 family)
MFDPPPKQRVAPGPGQESVWDYPRPPRLEPTPRHLKVVFAGTVVAETRRGLRLLETSHPPAYYFPPDDVRRDLLSRAPGRSLCEFKGQAAYWTLRVGPVESVGAAWSYPAPWPPYEALKDHLCFYAGRVEACFVDGERVVPQEGDFYGGWRTVDVVGPFKGGPGTRGW